MRGYPYRRTIIGPHLAYSTRATKLLCHDLSKSLQLDSDTASKWPIRTNLFRSTGVTKIPNHDNRRSIIFRGSDDACCLKYIVRWCVSQLHNLTLSGCQAMSLIPRLPPTAKLPPVPICPASVPAPPPYASATTSLFPLRSQTTVYPVLLAPARTYCTC